MRSLCFAVALQRAHRKVDSFGVGLGKKKDASFIRIMKLTTPIAIFSGEIDRSIFMPNVGVKAAPVRRRP